MTKPKETNGPVETLAEPTIKYDRLPVHRKKPTSNGSLKGLFYHQIKDGELQWFGRILDQVGDHVLVMTYDCLAGTEYACYVLPISELVWKKEARTGFVLYNSQELFEFSCECGEAHLARKRLERRLDREQRENEMTNG